jgi:DNA-binding MarR family transcriptional regulator
MAEDALAWALHRLAVAGAAFDSALARRLGVSPTAYVALKHVMSADTSMGPVELGRLLGMSSGSATALVDRLHASGHLERIPHPRDRRRLLLRSTPWARQRVLAELEPLADEIVELGRTFTAAERHAIVRFLTGAAALHRTHGR